MSQNFDDPTAAPAKPVMIYAPFERFWHWTQALLIVGLLATGFELHGSIALFGFQNALELHIIMALSLIVLWVFAIFWHFTTGEWKQYIPTTRRLWAQIYYYSIGIFRGDEHPFRKTRRRKHNPLQALAYLSLKLFISPAIWLSGMLLLSYSWWPASWHDYLSFGGVAVAHTLAAFVMLTFLIVHVYMATVGHSLLHHIKAMITGYDSDVGEETSTQAPQR
ncbi:MAG: cytochrome b/b6 domain-containing protein [Candidatus Competibacterales bacterium]